MAASGNKLESKKNFEEKVPLDNAIIKSTIDMLLFPKVDSNLKQILFLAEFAGPLDEFKFQVKKLINKEITQKNNKNSLIDEVFTMNGIKGSLVEILVSQLDVSIRNKSGEVLDKGMAECFLDIVKELLPDRLEEVRKKAEMAAPIEDVNVKLARDSMNFDVLHQVFNAIKQNDETITKQAIEMFKTFIQNKKLSFMNDQGYLTDNRYYMDLLHQIYAAFDILITRGGELSEGWYGKKADRFCFEIIGMLELELPPRMRQLLKSGLCNVLVGDVADRTIDANGVEFSNFKMGDNDFSVGVNAYYDDIGQCSNKIPAFAGSDRRTVEFGFLLDLLRGIIPVFDMYAPVSLPQNR